MNMFIVPSWYPSRSNPIYGIFNFEQAQMLFENKPSWNIGISKWGQGDKRYLLPVSSPSSLLKLFRRKALPSSVEISSRLIEYSSPAFIWTRKIMQGNIKGIIKANISNMDRYISDFGKVDIISVQASYPGALIGYELSKIYQIPYTVTARMGPFPFAEFLDRKENLRSWIKNPLQSADKLIATSHFLKERMIKLGLPTPEVIPNPIDINMFKLADQFTPNRLFAVGRMEQEKGFDLLLEALSIIDGDFKLILGGDGSLLNMLKKKAHDLKLTKKIIWKGLMNRAEVIAEMQACDFYILPSRYETFGNVVLEAMACGKPVVATACGGPQELVNEAVGIICKPNSADLSSAIHEMMKKRHLFDSNKIRQYICANFASTIWADRLEKLCTDIVKK